MPLNLLVAFALSGSPTVVGLALATQHLGAFFSSVFGATAIGWNGLYTAEVARHSPPGQVSVVTGGAMVWNFAGILAGPTAFTLAYRLVGSYSWTFGLTALVAVATLLALHAGRRAAAGGGAA